ncbi:Cof-like hydrolase [Alkaliphilus metalliredigens QYMF]|uniref:Cof-like hydrolase n=1 Tax=Alkaliphilus metalliredigens (strain QYMF) TaxID=293826 RepID=A6TU66_ALKMQ|nr:Cof-type HAD-IIB family hydrolase [Alkaliphilus metalliredigens]ABR49734.1 Cof-like hydrolase [Alkaliphilus metalliredigens QYMF]
MGYQLIILDMDGTLLNSDKEVSEENKKALQNVKDMGMTVAIATGRIFTSARFYARMLGITAPIIACNGALIRDHQTNEVVYSNPIRLEDAIAIAKLCKEKGVYFHFYNQEQFYIEELGFSSLKYHDWNERQNESDRIHMEKMTNAVEFLTNNAIEVLKFVIMDEDPKKLKEIKEALDEMKTLETDKSWYNNLEVMNKGVSKGKAIKRLAEILQITQEKRIAFGDNYNDLSMKESVRTFVAMENGEEFVKERADYITASNDESGVAKGIKKYILL